jgi:replicative superfamily II helicase
MFNKEDQKLIKELGLEDLSEAEQIVYLDEFLNTLDMRIGMAVEDALSDEQLAEFEKVSGKGDDEATAAWIKKAVPDFGGLVAKEQAALIKEIRESAARIRKIIHEKPSDKSAGDATQGASGKPAKQGGQRRAAPVHAH